MKTVVQEFLERIIHKPMPLDPGQPLKDQRSNDHTKMAVQARITGPSMASMLVAFVNHLQRNGLQFFTQAVVERSGGRKVCAHGAGGSSVEASAFRYGEM